MEGNLPDSEATKPRKSQPSRDRPDRPRLALVTVILMFVAAMLSVIGALLPMLH